MRQSEQTIQPEMRERPKLRSERSSKKSTARRAAARRQIRLRTVIPVHLLADLKRDLTSCLRCRPDWQRYDENKVEDFLLQVASDFSLFATVPAEDRQRILLLGLRNVIEDNEAFMSSLNAAWHFAADAHGAAVHAVRLREWMSVCAAAERDAKQEGRAQAATTPDTAAASEDADWADTLHVLQRDGHRVTRSWKGMLCQQVVATTGHADARHRLPPSGSATRSDASGAVVNARASIPSRPTKRPPSATRQPTAFPVWLAPFAAQYLLLKVPQVPAEVLQAHLLMAMLQNDGGAPAYLPNIAIAAASRAAKRGRRDRRPPTSQTVNTEHTTATANAGGGGAYERARLARVREHVALLAALGLGNESSGRGTPSPQASSGDARSSVGIDASGSDPGSEPAEAAERNGLLSDGHDGDDRDGEFWAFLRRHTPAERLAPASMQMWVGRCAQAVATVARALTDPQHGAPAITANAGWQSRLVQRNEFATYRRRTAQVCARYVQEMNSRENRRKRRYRNVHYSDETGALPDNASDTEDTPQMSTSAEPPPKRRPALTSTATAAQPRFDAHTGIISDGTEESYLWTDDDYRNFFAAWQRYGNDVYANRRIAQAMNRRHAARPAPARSIRSRISPATARPRRPRPSAVPLIHPSHVAYQKRLHRGWLEQVARNETLPLSELIPRGTHATCYLCGDGAESETAPTAALMGPFWELDWQRPREPAWVHRACLLWAPEVFETCEGTMMNVGRAVRRARHIRCAHCRRVGAATGCYIDACRKSYHAPECARHAGCSLDERGFRLLCATHARMHERATSGGCRGFWAQVHAQDAAQHLVFTADADE
ncbi:hypothetical protein CDCA_CDCA09G2672 [Cyanidium caldarium]|uniref:PHD-type domain-containing protein n=1 Tax=Cyanidium caldarium TaxID=2771 RepID=A0AAV9IWK6_CYACA|nr:hypothetical protein CDCA_CDCA09G2672 [Cyanidium caldarium]